MIVPTEFPFEESPDSGTQYYTEQDGWSCPTGQNKQLDEEFSFGNVRDNPGPLVSPIENQLMSYSQMLHPTPSPSLSSYSTDMVPNNLNEGGMYRSPFSSGSLGMKDSDYITDDAYYNDNNGHAVFQAFEQDTCHLPEIRQQETPPDRKRKQTVEQTRKNSNLAHTPLSEEKQKEKRKRNAESQRRTRLKKKRAEEEKDRRLEQKLSECEMLKKKLDSYLLRLEKSEHENMRLQTEIFHLRHEIAQRNSCPYCGAAFHFF